MPNKSLVATMAVLAVAAHSTEAFAPPATGLAAVKSSVPGFSPLYAEESSEETAVFMPPAEEEPAEETPEGEISLNTVEMLGRGAAKVCNFFTIVTHSSQQLQFGRNFVVLLLLTANHQFFYYQTGQARKAQGRTRCQDCWQRQGLCHTSARGSSLRRTSCHYRNHYPHRFYFDRHWNYPCYCVVVSTSLGSL